MQVLDRIKAIEEQCADLNLSLRQLCRRAGVDYGNVFRWKNAACSPRMDNYEAAMLKLEVEVRNTGLEMYQKLEPKYSGPVSSTAV